eukprot:TRINITY_DN1952_c0_g1_i4.p1 TRINITY_DN1952_c0_g1~~TRINITY_DN1952_c0_g1_i4.p1  ORF type:complete len:310 (+),score=47.49 TRINITY_DN1952_c0_g1_i4:52-981(+)
MEERMMNASLNRRKSLETSQFFLASSRATHSPRLKGAVSKMQRYSALKSSLTEDALSTLKFEVEYKRRKLETEKYQRILDMRSIGDDESLLEEKAAAYLQHLSWLESDVSRYFVVRRPIPPPMPDLNIQPPEKAHVLFVSGRTKGKAGNAVASELQGPPLTLMYESVRRLDGSTWLNDEVINFYYRLIAKRALDSGGSLPRLHVFTTYFYIKLMTNGKFNYSAVSSWTRKINLFDLEMIFVPIHRGNHWCTSMIDMKNKQICYYDSLFGGRKNLEVPKDSARYVRPDSAARKYERLWRICVQICRETEH